MEKYEFHSAIRLLQDFFWHDVCDDYLEYVKYRIYGEDADSKKAAQLVLYRLLYTFTKLMAPFTPHISEEIYHEMYRGKDGETINYAPWPKPGERFGSEFNEVDPFRALISSARQHKAAHRLSQSTWLSKASVSAPKGFPQELLEELKNIARIRELELKEGGLEIDFSDSAPEA
jgi:valyl-tRNA synthetase